MEHNKLNINKASKEQISRIGGIGGRLAEEIIKYRESHDGFRNEEELRQVPGFDEVIVEKIKNHLFIEK